jgi:hypothetical protein
MTRKIVSRERRISTIAAASAAAAMLGWLCFSTDAEVQAGAPAATQELAAAGAPVDLERAFWLCDYAGTNGSVDSGTALACSAVTEELKNSKFNGDFDALVAWWRENKPAEHGAIEQARVASVAGSTAAAGGN